MFRYCSILVWKLALVAAEYAITEEKGEKKPCSGYQKLTWYWELSQMPHKVLDVSDEVEWKKFFATTVHCSINKSNFSFMGGSWFNKIILY